MTIYQRMNKVFRDASVPGFFQSWRATKEYPELPDKYAVYTVTNDTDEFNADDVEFIHRSDVVIYLFGATDITPECTSLSRALQGAGFCIARGRDAATALNGSIQNKKRIDATYYDFHMGEEQDK